MPVGARMAAFLRVVLLRMLNKVDLPVPARPVIKRFSPFSTRSRMALNSSLICLGKFFMPAII
jgi:hypothetical protein